MRIDTEHGWVSLSGAFDGRSSAEVRQALEEQLAGRSADLVVDLSEVDAVDVIALRVLAATTRRAARDGHRVVLRGCGPGVRRLLHRTRLIRLVELEPVLV